MKPEDEFDVEADRLFDMVRDGFKDENIVTAIAASLRRVRAETVVMCKANVVVDVEEEFRNGEFVRATASLDWSAVDAAVKEGAVVRADTTEDCDTCGGVGRTPPNSRRCEDCGGSGRIYRPGSQHGAWNCGYCNGSGRVPAVKEGGGG